MVDRIAQRPRRQATRFQREVPRSSRLPPSRSTRIQRSDSDRSCYFINYYSCFVEDRRMEFSSSYARGSHTLDRSGRALAAWDDTMAQRQSTHRQMHVEPPHRTMQQDSPSRRDVLTPRERIHMLPPSVTVSTTLLDGTIQGIRYNDVNLGAIGSGCVLLQPVCGRSSRTWPIASRRAR